MVVVVAKDTSNVVEKSCGLKQFPMRRIQPMSPYEVIEQPRGKMPNSLSVIPMQSVSTRETVHGKHAKVLPFRRRLTMKMVEQQPFAEAVDRSMAAGCTDSPHHLLKHQRPGREDVRAVRI